METILKFYLDSVTEELEFLANEDLWTESFSGKVVVRATGFVYRTFQFIETFDEIRKSSVYSSLKKATHMLFNAYLRLAACKESPEVLLDIFKKATAEFSQSKEDILKEIQSLKNT